MKQLNEFLLNAVKEGYPIEIKSPNTPKNQKFLREFWASLKEFNNKTFKKGRF